MPQGTFWWVFLFAWIFGFFFGYGMVEDLIRMWVSNRRSGKEWVEKSHDNPDPRGNGHLDSTASLSSMLTLSHHHFY